MTGTLWSGSIGAGDVLRVEPAGLDVRVRSVEVHDAPVERAEAGRRVAVALPGVERQQVRRGDVLASRARTRSRTGSTSSSPSSSRSRTTRACTSITGRPRSSPGSSELGERFAQLRLAAPVVAARGDRVVLRNGHTLGGGRVLDPAPPRAPIPRGSSCSRGRPGLDRERARARARPHPRARGPRAALRPSSSTAGLESVERAGDWYVAPEWLEQIEREVRTRLMLRAAAAPLDPGLSAGELLPGAPWADAVLALLDVEQRGGKAYLPGAAAELGERGQEAAALEARLVEAGPGRGGRRRGAGSLSRGVRPARAARRRPGDSARVRGGEAVRVDECEREGAITLARFRDVLGISRRPAQLLLERLDADGVTRRIGDERVLRRGATIDR